MKKYSQEYINKIAQEVVSKINEKQSINEITKKVIAAIREKDAAFEIDASILDKVKNFFIGVGLVGTLFSTPAHGKAVDVDKYLTNLQETSKSLDPELDSDKKFNVYKKYTPDIKDEDYWKGKELGKSKGDGYGDYTILVGPYSIKGRFFSKGDQKDHEVKMEKSPKANPKELSEYSHTAKKLFYTLQSVGPIRVKKDTPLNREELTERERVKEEQSQKAEVARKKAEMWRNFADALKGPERYNVRKSGPNELEITKEN